MHADQHITNTHTHRLTRAEPTSCSFRTRSRLNPSGPPHPVPSRDARNNHARAEAHVRTDRHAQIPSSPFHTRSRLHSPGSPCPCPSVPSSDVRNDHARAEARARSPTHPNPSMQIPRSLLFVPAPIYNPSGPSCPCAYAPSSDACTDPCMHRGPHVHRSARADPASSARFCLSIHPAHLVGPTCANPPVLSFTRPTLFSLICALARHAHRSACAYPHLSFLASLLSEIHPTHCNLVLVYPSLSNSLAYLPTFGPPYCYARLRKIRGSEQARHVIAAAALQT